MSEDARQRSGSLGLVQMSANCSRVRAEPPVQNPSDFSLSRESRERFQNMLGAIRDSETQRELMLYVERFFTLQGELRQYFSLIEREIAEKLREFREIEEGEAADAGPADDDLAAWRDRDQHGREEETSPS